MISPPFVTSNSRRVTTRWFLPWPLSSETLGRSWGKRRRRRRRSTGCGRTTETTGRLRRGDCGTAYRGETNSSRWSAGIGLLFCRRVVDKQLSEYSELIGDLLLSIILKARCETFQSEYMHGLFFRQIKSVKINKSCFHSQIRIYIYIKSWFIYHHRVSAGAHSMDLDERGLTLTLSAMCFLTIRCC